MLGRPTIYDAGPVLNSHLMRLVFVWDIIIIFFRDTLKQVPKLVPKFSSSEVPKFRELQVPNFQVPGTSSSEIPK